MREKTLEQFIAELSSKAPTPGGGGASALAGAIGAGLASMVASLTDGKKKYAEYQTDIDRILQEAECLAGRLLDLIREDASAFEPLSRAYSLPTETPEETDLKEQVMEQALLTASLVPLQIMETVMEVIDLQEELLIKGSVLAVSDVGVGVKMLEAALEGASLNIYINTRMMKDREQAERLNTQADELIRRGKEKTQTVWDQVWGRLR